MVSPHCHTKKSPDIINSDRLYLLLPKEVALAAAGVVAQCKRNMLPVVGICTEISDHTNMYIHIIRIGIIIQTLVAFSSIYSNGNIIIVFWKSRCPG